MGNILKRVMCPIYPVEDSDSDDDSIHKRLEPLKPSEIIEREYIKNEEKEVKQNILLRPSQIIKIENEKLQRLINT